jgi:hypothetical protein
MGKRDKRKKNLTAEDKEKAKAKAEKKDQKAQSKHKKKELNDVGAWVARALIVHASRALH